MSAPTNLGRNAVLRVLLPAALAALAVESARAGDPAPPPTLLGTSGLVITPTAVVLPPDAVRFGVGILDRKWSYLDRGPSDNYNFHLSAGFLPRVEISLRGSYAPEDRLVGDEQFEPGNVDRGGGARLLLLRERAAVPAVAAGIDDVQGTKLFHSLYLVGTKSVGLDAGRWVIRGSLGYGSDALDARNYVLEGAFGGAEVVFADAVSLAIENDTEKWNGGVRVDVLGHLNVQFVLLDLETPAGGISWVQRL